MQKMTLFIFAHTAISFSDPVIRKEWSAEKQKYL
jgi:hypothetical protein